MDRTRPLMLGLVGESAAGKTTLTRGVVRILGRDGVTPICLDDYHRLSRADRLARGLTAADPAANDLATMAEHLAVLRAGGRVTKPVYDHRSGEVRGPEMVAATGLVVAYGMLTLTPPASPELFDLTVYLDPDPALRRSWRMARDVQERGYTPTEVAANAPSYERDAARFVQLQRPLADLVVRFRPAAAGLDAELLFRAAGGEPDPLHRRLAAAGLPGIRVSDLRADEDGRACEQLSVAAALEPEAVAAAATLIWDALPALAPTPLESIGQVRGEGGMRHIPALALVQLLIVARLVRRRSLSASPVL
jgi:phosphoribulokinase